MHSAAASSGIVSSICFPSYPSTATSGCRAVAPGEGLSAGVAVPPSAVQAVVEIIVRAQHVR